MSLDVPPAIPCGHFPDNGDPEAIALKLEETLMGERPDRRTGRRQLSSGGAFGEGIRHGTARVGNCSCRAARDVASVFL